MGRRSRQRGAADKLEAPTTDYASPEGQVLTLRGALSPKTRQQYAKAADSALVKAFATYVTSAEGQEAAGKAAGSAPLTDALRTKITASIAIASVSKPALSSAMAIE